MYFNDQLDDVMKNIKKRVKTCLKCHIFEYLMYFNKVIFYKT